MRLEKQSHMHHPYRLKRKAAHRKSIPFGNYLLPHKIIWLELEMPNYELSTVMTIKCHCSVQFLRMCSIISDELKRYALCSVIELLRWFVCLSAQSKYCAHWYSSITFNYKKAEGFLHLIHFPCSAFTAKSASIDWQLDYNFDWNEGKPVGICAQIRVTQRSWSNQCGRDKTKCCCVLVFLLSLLRFSFCFRLCSFGVLKREWAFTKK